MPDFIENANVRLVSDGTLQGTHVYFVEGDKETEIVPVQGVEWSLSLSKNVAEMTVALFPGNAVVPAKLVKFIERPDVNEVLLGQRDRARELVRHLFAMVPREVWRDTGGDDGQGHYEGDYRAASLEEEIARWDDKEESQGA